MNSNDEVSHKPGKYYNETQLIAAAVLGGPISAGILFFRNFNLLNRRKDALFSILITVVLSSLLVYLLMEIPDTSLSKIPNFVFSAMYAIPTFICYRLFLKNDIEDLKEKNFSKKSNWGVAGFTLIGIVIFLLISLGIGFLHPPFPGDKINIGETNNTIYFDGALITKSEIETLASNLNNLGYFGPETANNAHLTKNGDNYYITLTLTRTLWEDPGIKSDISFMKANLSFNYNSEVTIVLEDYDITGKTYTRVY